MDDEFIFPAADLYRPVYDHAPPSDPSKSILFLPTEIIVNIAQLNFKTAVALMCTNRVLHAAGVTALYARVYLRGRTFSVLNPDAPNLVVPGVLGGLLVKREHTAALRYLKILSMPYDTKYRTAFSALIYRVFKQAHGLVCIDLQSMYEHRRPPSPGNDLLQPAYPQNLHTLHLYSPTDHFVPHLLTTPSLKEVRFGEPCWMWSTFLEHNQGPYSQLTSLSYTHQPLESHTLIGDFLKIFELFPSVEKLEVTIDQLSEFLDCVPQMGNSWAKVKHLCLIFVLRGLGFGLVPMEERTKRLLVQAFDTLCPVLDTAEVRGARGGITWPVMWVGGRGDPHEMIGA